MRHVVRSVRLSAVLRDHRYVILALPLPVKEVGGGDVTGQWVDSKLVEILSGLFDFVCDLEQSNMNDALFKRQSGPESFVALNIISFDTHVTEIFIFVPVCRSYSDDVCSGTQILCDAAAVTPVFIQPYKLWDLIVNIHQLDGDACFIVKGDAGAVLKQYFTISN